MLSQSFILFITLWPPKTRSRLSGSTWNALTQSFFLFITLLPATFTTFRIDFGLRVLKKKKNWNQISSISSCGHFFWSFLYKIHFWLILPNFKILAFFWRQLWSVNRAIVWTPLPCYLHLEFFWRFHWHWQECVVLLKIPIRVDEWSCMAIATHLSENLGTEQGQ